MAETTVAGAGAGAAEGARSIIDSDVHVDVPKVEALFPYLPPYWVEHVRQTVFKGPTDYPYPRNAPITWRPGSKPEADATTADRLELLRAQLLDADGVERAILQCSYGIEGLHNPDAAVAFAAATNDWLIAEYLDREPRLRAAMVVPSQIPELAAREIERVGDHPGFVQVMLPARSHLPWGNRIHHPLFEAAARTEKAVALHFGGAPGNPPTPSGWPSYYVEEYVDMATVFASQLTSIVCEGLFDQFPSLRVVLLESGFTWLPAHLWRFDKEWRNQRRLVPWVKRAPSAYLREHVRLTIQPLDAPPSLAQMLQVVDQIDGEEMLLYASDYPHAHTFDPERSLLPDLPAGLARRIRSENARALYRLD
jgi:predicted TIM-barrel fold metal-dependent hydrolase